MTGGKLQSEEASRVSQERDLEAEFDAHLAHRVDDLVSEGLSEVLARERAKAEFGDRERLKAESWAVRSRARRRHVRASRLDGLRQDLSYSLRQLWRSPGFALTALATLMLGVGATATIVSVVHAVAFEDLPFTDPDQVVFAEMLTPAGARFSVAEPAFLDWQEQARSFVDMAAATTSGATLRSPGQPRTIVLGHISNSLLEVLGLRPEIGRMFRADEDVSGNEAQVALISSDMWQSNFGGDPAVLGTRLDLDGRLFEIIGVMPESFEILLEGIPVFVPLGPDPNMDRDEHALTVVARLAEGVVIGTAQIELQEIQQALGETFAADQGWSATLFSSEDTLVGESTTRAGWVLLMAAGLLLAMASVNVSNLLMIRATARQGEVGLRAALGASRGRLVRQLFTESALLAGLGGGLGLAFAYAALPLVKTMGAARIPRLDAAVLGGSALFACFGSVAVVTLACGLAPVVQMRGGGAGRSVGSLHRRATDPGGRLRSLLVGAQISMTVVLLAGTGLLLRSFVALSNVDPGFDAQGTLAVRLDMPDQAFSWQERSQLVPRLRNAVEALPGVVAVGATAIDPFSGSSLANFVARNDRLPDRAADFTPVHWRIVTPGFFEAMGMEVKAGRTFSETDELDGFDPVVIGSKLARLMWGEENPVDRTLVWGDLEGSRLRVVGVVEDLRDVALAEDPLPMVYLPHRRVPWAVMILVARVQGDPIRVAAAIRSRIQEAVPGLPVPEIRSLEDNLHQAVAEPRFNLQLLSSFAVVGLLMSIIGVYGLTAFDVRRRYREIGIRLSLGAEPRAIQTMILRHQMTIALVGITVGVGVAWVLTRWIENQLFGITANDLTTWLGAVTVVAVASALATYGPARVATRVDPREVLNAE